MLGKAPGPDDLTTYIVKHRASKIAPILQMDLRSLLILAHFQKIGLLPILHQFIRKAKNIQHAMDQQKQVDLILYFSKAFDMVPHQCLLTKLAHNYGIQGDAHRWISSWLTLRKQRVVVCRWRSIRFCNSKVWSTTRNCVRTTNVSLVY